MSYELIHDATELRKLIAENPDLPIVVLASEEANSGEWGWQYSNHDGREEAVEAWNRRASDEQ